MKLIDNLEKNYRKTMAEKGVQIVFCDIAINEDETHFSVYKAIKQALIERGIPEKEICFAGDAKTDKARDEMFKSLRKGEKRFIIASTSKLGTGANIQDRICAIHHLDIPWKPSDLTQQDGRGIRQGNRFSQVGIYHYLTEETFQSTGDAIADIHEDLAAEQKARLTYDNILRLADDPDVRDPIKFLREREIVHYQRFGEGLRLIQDMLDSKNFYAFNPSFDK
jgi:hypothetical protein